MVKLENLRRVYRYDLIPKMSGEVDTVRAEFFSVVPLGVLAAQDPELAKEIENLRESISSEVYVEIEVREIEEIADESALREVREAWRKKSVLSPRPQGLKDFLAALFKD